MCQVFGGAEAEDPVDNEIGVYIQSLCEKNSLLMQYKNILEQVRLCLFLYNIKSIFVFIRFFFIQMNIMKKLCN